LIRDFFKQPHHIFVGRLPDGTVMDEWPRYDDDDFRAFLTHYRKLRAKRDATNLFSIINLLWQKGDPADHKDLAFFRSEIIEEGKGWWRATLREPNGDQILLMHEDLEDLILNAEVFHPDLEKRKTLDRLLGNSSLVKAVAFWNYLRFARTVAGYAQKAAEVIRQRGYLNPATASEKSQAAQCDHAGTALSCES